MPARLLREPIFVEPVGLPDEPLEPLRSTARLKVRLLTLMSTCGGAMIGAAAFIQTMRSG